MPGLNQRSSPAARGVGNYRFPTYGRNGILCDLRKTPAHPGCVVFPIYNAHETDQYQIWKLIGTGFFVHPQGVFVTARHVAEEMKGYSNRPFALVLTTSKELAILRIRTLASSPYCDVAIGRTEASVDPVTNQLVENGVVKLTTRPIEVGEYVFSLGHPNAVIRGSIDERKVELAPHYSRGRIESYCPDGRDKMMPFRCWQTSLYIPSGASGGPVFDQKGCVFAVNTSGYDLKNEAPISYITPIDDIFSLPFQGGEPSPEGTPYVFGSRHAINIERKNTFLYEVANENMQLERPINIQGFERRSLELSRKTLVFDHEKVGQGADWLPS